MAGSIVKRPGREAWYVEFTHPERTSPIRWRGGATKTAANAKLRKLIRLVDDGASLAFIKRQVFGVAVDGILTVSDLLDGYLAGGCRHKRASTIKNDTNRVENLKKWERSSAPADRLRASDVIDLVNGRLDTGVKISTVRRELAVLAGAYAWAIDEERLELTENPVRVAIHKRRKAWKQPESDSAYYMSAEECTETLKHAGGLEPLVFTALTTAARRGELLSLRWQDVDFDVGDIVIRAETAKNGESRSIRMSPLLQARLQSQFKSLKTVDRRRFVFEGLTGNAVSKRWTLIREATGIPARFHDLRHTAAATMAKACVPLSTIQKIGGWKTLAMVARYTRFVPEGTPTIALDALVKGATS